MTSPWMDDELILLGDQAARFIAIELAPHAPAWERERVIDRASWLKAGEAGLLCASIPEEYGGGGGTLAHEAVIQQELARALMGGSFGTSHNIHSCIVAHYIHAYGTEEQRRRWLPPMARGELIGALAMTEPGTGSDLRSIRTTASPSPNGYRLSGQKTFISNGQSADLVLVAARTGGEGQRGELSLLAVETAGMEGFHRGRNLEKLGTHGQDTSELFFDDCQVPADHLLGGESGRGFAQMTSQLAWERMTIALTALVNMETAVAMTTDYVRQRNAFGKALMDFQNTQFVLADAATQASAARALFDTKMVRLLAGQLDGAEAAKVKLFATDTGFKVIDACQQLFGGYGYMVEYPIARLWADTRVTRVYGGANEVMKMIIARSL